MPDDDPHEPDHDAATDDDVAVAEAEPDAKPKTQPDPPTPRSAGKPNPKPLPPHAVVLHNDPNNGFEFVAASLMKVFRYDALRAFKLTTAAHLKGRSIVWTGQKEHAELKAEQIKGCGADPAMKAKGAKPLRVTVEPLPG